MARTRANKTKKAPTYEDGPELRAAVRAEAARRFSAVAQQPWTKETEAAARTLLAGVREVQDDARKALLALQKCAARLTQFCEDHPLLASAWAVAIIGKDGDRRGSGQNSAIAVHFAREFIDQLVSLPEFKPERKPIAWETRTGVVALWGVRQPQGEPRGPAELAVFSLAYGNWPSLKSKRRWLISEVIAKEAEHMAETCKRLNRRTAKDAATRAKP